MSASSPKWVQPVVDYTGLICFVAVYVITRDLLQASLGLAAGSAVGLLVGFVMQRKLALMPLFAGGTAIFFAGLSYLLHDAFWVKIKLTVVDGIFAIALFGGQALGKRPLQALMGEAIKMSDDGWRKLTIRYALFFVFLGALNAVLAFAPSVPEEAWVAFRFPGVPILLVLFSLAQTPMLMREMKDQEAAAEVPPPPAS